VLTHLLLLTVLTCAASAADRITRTIDSARTVALARRVPSPAGPENDRGPADPAMPIEGATLLFKPGPGLDALCW